MPLPDNPAMVHGNENEWNTNTYTLCIIMELGKCAEWKKSILKGYILYYSINTTLFNDKIPEMENRSVIAKDCSQDTEWERVVDDDYKQPTRRILVM